MNSRRHPLVDVPPVHRLSPIAGVDFSEQAAELVANSELAFAKVQGDGFIAHAACQSLHELALGGGEIRSRIHGFTTPVRQRLHKM